MSRTRPDLRAKEAWKAAGQRRALLKAGVPWYSRLLEQPARTEPTHDEYNITEVLYPVYEVKTGDPFIGCEIAGWEIAWSRGRLDALIGRFDETVLGRGDTQQKQAFRRTAEVLADRLAETERLCAQLGLQNAPSHIDPSPLDDCFGLDQDLARLGRDLVELAQIVRVWPYHADAQLSWPDPDTMSTLLQQDFVAYQGVWHKLRKYGGPAHTDLVEVSRRLWQRRLRGSIDLITWAEALAWAAEAIVAGLDGSHSQRRTGGTRPGAAGL